MTAIHALACLGALAVLARAQEPEPKPAPQPESRPQAEAEPPETAPDTEPEAVLVIRGADVHVGDGTLLRRADVVVRGSKIDAVGRDLELPKDAKTIDATGRFVSPGFVMVRAGGFGAPRAFGLEAIEDALNPYDPTIALGLAVGITAFGMITDEGRDVPKGKSAVLKLAPGDLEGMLCAKDTFVSMSVPLDPKQWRSLRELVDSAKEHREKVAETAKQKDVKPPKPPRGVESILPVLEGAQLVWVRSRGGPLDHDMLRQAIEIADLLGRGVVVERPVTAWAAAADLARTGSMVALLPRQQIEPDPGRPATTGSNLAAAAILARAGVPVAVMPPSTSLSLDGLLGQDLNTPTVDAAFAVRGGLDNRKALRTITLDAARLLGVGARIGSIEVGKDADLLILDGDPLHYRTLVETALVNGKVVYERQKAPFYRHLER